VVLHVCALHRMVQGFPFSTDGLHTVSARPSALFPRRSRMLRLISTCLGQGLLPPPGPDLFTKYARRLGCAGRQSSIFDYSCFSLSKRRRGKLTPPPLFLHFAFCTSWWACRTIINRNLAIGNTFEFCVLVFRFSLYIFRFLPIRYPLSALLATHDESIKCAWCFAPK